MVQSPLPPPSPPIVTHTVSEYEEIGAPPPSWNSVVMTIAAVLVWVEGRIQDIYAFPTIYAVGQSSAGFNIIPH